MIYRIANFFSDLDALIFILSIIVSVALFGYVASSWLIHFVSVGSYLIAAFVAGILLVLVVATLLRIPLAQIVVLGSASICGTAFLLGYDKVVFP